MSVYFSNSSDSIGDQIRYLLNGNMKKRGGGLIHPNYLGLSLAKLFTFCIMVCSFAGSPIMLETNFFEFIS